MQARSFSRTLARVLGGASLLLLAACNAETPASSSPGVTLLQQAAASGRPTIAEFGAKTCTSCREMKVILDQVAQRTAGEANVLIIDITEDWQASQEYRIQMMPTQVFFDVHGKEIGRHIGKLSEAEVIEGLAAGRVR
jgi:thioredoxin 1